MEQPPLIGRLTASAHFLSAPGASLPMAEMWPLDSDGPVGVQAQRGHFSQNFGFADPVMAVAVRAASAAEESTMTNQSGRVTCVGAGGRKRRDAITLAVSEDETSMPASTGSVNDAADSNVKRLKIEGTRGGNVDPKELEATSGNSVKMIERNVQPSEPPKQDYIHVRARRGQATDSHSLAERARREKISERMKILQELVPGCDKVIGKALVLDEIINYVQSLQHQVEFLSMKLEAVNSRIHSSIADFPTKDFGMQTFDAGSMAFASQAARDHGQGSPKWLHMQVGSGFDGASQFLRPSSIVNKGNEHDASLIGHKRTCS